MTDVNSRVNVDTPPQAIRLTQLVEAEYAEMPGLSITLSQAQRLWTVDRATCERVFSRLTAEGILRRTMKGRFVRA
jgi:hypothetical protein